jgi:phosphonate transport system ATP-binding protein
MLQLKQIHKRFGDVRAVDGVSLHIQEGEMVGIIGRSGAGKSTSLRLINRLIDVDEGGYHFQQHRGAGSGWQRDTDHQIRYFTSGISGDTESRVVLF